MRNPGRMTALLLAAMLLAAMLLAATLAAMGGPAFAEGVEDVNDVDNEIVESEDVEAVEAEWDDLIACEDDDIEIAAERDVACGETDEAEADEAAVLDLSDYADVEAETDDEVETTAVKSASSKKSGSGKSSTNSSKSSTSSSKSSGASGQSSGKSSASKGGSASEKRGAEKAKTVEAAANAETADGGLTLNGEVIDITLDGGASDFTATQSEDTLALTPEDAGEAWRIGPGALRTLLRQGVERLELTLGEAVFALELSEADSDADDDGPAWTVTADGIALECDAIHVEITSPSDDPTPESVGHAEKRAKPSGGAAASQGV